MNPAKALIVLFCLILLHGCGSGGSVSPNSSNFVPLAVSQRAT